MAAKIQQRNEVVNRQCAELQAKLSAEGFGVMWYGRYSVELARNVLSQSFKKIIETNEFPMGRRWIEDLELLSAVKIINGSRFNYTEKILLDSFKNLLVTGVKKDSEACNEARELVKEFGYDCPLLVENPLLPGYSILQVVEQRELYSLYIRTEGGYQIVPLSEEGVSLAERIKGLYDVNGRLQETVKHNFIEYMRADEYVRAAMDWHDSIPVAFEMTPASKMRAHANAMRLGIKIPIFV